MLCHLLELAMFIGGIIALIRGKLSITRNLKVEGKAARVAGLVLMVPLPFAFAGIIMFASKSQVYLDNNRFALAIFELFTMFICCVIVYAICLNCNRPEEIWHPGDPVETNDAADLPRKD